VPAVYEGIVPFHDCDPLGIVWHGNYYKYMELGRTELFRLHKVDVHDLIDMGLKLVVTESRCRHPYPLRYSERFRVTAWFREIELGLHVGYEIYNVTRERRSCRGWTTLVTLRDEEMTLETPHEITSRIRAV
jgi:acyl-CoA thioester hydrolase